MFSAYTGVGNKSPFTYRPSVKQEIGLYDSSEWDKFN